jgi:hypothetical protein
VYVYIIWPSLSFNFYVGISVLSSGAVMPVTCSLTQYYNSLIQFTIEDYIFVGKDVWIDPEPLQSSFSKERYFKQNSLFTRLSVLFTYISFNNLFERVYSHIIFIFWN